MHAWGAVSHYLDYKGDWDVPADLKRALSALSGLFYVADNEFEQFYAARIQSRKAAEEKQQQEVPREVNYDTVMAYLKAKFPDRSVVHGDASTVVSTFVQELKAADYRSLIDVDRDIDRAADAFESWEGGVQKKQSGVGVARVSLRIASNKFLAAGVNPDSWQELTKLRHLVKKM